MLPAPLPPVAFTYARVINASGATSVTMRVVTNVTALPQWTLFADPSLYQSLVPAPAPVPRWGPPQPDARLGRDFLLLYWVAAAVDPVPGDGAAAALPPSAGPPLASAIGGGVVAGLAAAAVIYALVVRSARKKGKIMASSTSAAAGVSGSGATGSEAGAGAEASATQRALPQPGSHPLPPPLQLQPLPQEMSATPVVINNVLAPQSRAAQV